MQLPPIMAMTHAGADWVHVIRRSVRKMPVLGSTFRERVSTAMTCEEDLFHGQYLSQLAVDTSFQL